MRILPFLYEFLKKKDAIRFRCWKCGKENIAKTKIVTKIGSDCDGIFLNLNCQFCTVTKDDVKVATINAIRIFPK